MSKNPSAYKGALGTCAELFQFGATVGYDFTLLDIGGGFPGEKGSTGLFDEMAEAIKEGLTQHFCYIQCRHLKVVAEPGTCMYTLE